ncbi:MAG: hypothetical protein U0231_10380 [Nitrospiraceae bacterium]
MASLPPAEESINIADIKTPTDMASIGQKIFFSKGCALSFHRTERIGALS